MARLQYLLFNPLSSDETLKGQYDGMRLQCYRDRTSSQLHHYNDIEYIEGVSFCYFPGSCILSSPLAGSWTSPSLRRRYLTKDMEHGVEDEDFKLGFF